MNLSDRKWEPFELEDLFDIQSGKRLESYNFVDGKRPFIGAIDDNNGITAYVSNTNSSLDKNVLGVNYNGNGMVISFYHPYECIFTDDVKRFHLKYYPDDENVLLFFKVIILQQKKKYNYGYKFNALRMNRQKILVPVNKNGDPDYGFMRDFIKEHNQKLVNNGLTFFKKKIANLQTEQIESLDKKKWEPFFISGDSGVFKLRSSNSGIDKNKLLDSNYLYIPYITRSYFNNGYNMFVGEKQQDGYSIDNGNVISIGLDTQSVFYQPYQFYTGQNIQVLYSDKLNELNALFIAPLLMKQLQKFNWGGNGATLGRLSRTKILLPVKNKEPDFDYMETYIRNIMIRQCKAYIDYKK